MKYDVEFLKEAKEEINKLDDHYQGILKVAYETIKNNGIEYLDINSLGNKLFEIKDGKTRSIYKYQEGQIIIIKLAQKRLNNI